MNMRWLPRLGRTFSAYVFVSFEIGTNAELAASSLDRVESLKDQCQFMVLSTRC